MRKRRSAARIRSPSNGARMPLRTQVAVVTYRRPELLGRLLEQLEDYPNVTVDVFDDDPETTARYAPLSHHIAEYNHGKERFWQWITRVFAVLREHDAGRFVFLPDDVSLCDNFIEHCEKRWATLPKDAVSLNLLVDDRATKANWTGQLPVRFNAIAEETWWTDGCFYADRRFFEALDWEIYPIDPARWQRNCNGVPPGSGVWAQVSQRLHGRGCRMFRSYQSLVYHHDCESLMNPVARRRDPLTTRRWIDADGKKTEVTAKT